LGGPLIVNAAKERTMLNRTGGRALLRALSAVVVLSGLIGSTDVSAQRVPQVSRLSAFPVAGGCGYADTWGDPRSGGRSHEGVDIIAASGTPVVAVVNGTITRVVRDYPGSLGGNYFRLTHADGTYFTYIHLSRFAAGLSLGDAVRTGQVLGYVGSTGSSATPHLHFEVHPFGGAAVNPTPFVTAAGGCKGRIGAPSPTPTPTPTPTPPSGTVTKKFSPAVEVYNVNARVPPRTPTGVQIVGFPGLASTSKVASITVTLTSSAAGKAAVWPCGTAAGLAKGTPLSATKSGSVTSTTLTIQPGDGGRVCLEAEAAVSIKIVVNGVG
jgi:Peptidase family M23